MSESPSVQPDSLRPTAQDMERDLRDDLNYYLPHTTDLALWFRYTVPQSPGAARRFAEWAGAAHPAAIRRAICAEAEVARLRKLNEGLAERVAAQSDLLTAKACRDGAGEGVARLRANADDTTWQG